MRTTAIIRIFLLVFAAVFAQRSNKTKAADSHKQKDIAAIKSMAGIYKVSFDFAETFSPDTGYKYFPRYREWGIEYVTIVEESENKIVLQHLLIVADTMIIKHWRQDWVYENTALYHFYKDKNWIRTTLSPDQVKGTWSQKVYQVDDSPRYEGYGTWIHVDGRHFWQSIADAPLPRREFTKRSDYNAMRRHSQIELLADGWLFDQDNEKLLRANGTDRLICWEKGVEKFSKGDYNATPAQKWWNAQQDFWADVRAEWDKIYAATPDLKLAPKVKDKLLFEALFALGDKHSVGKKYVRHTASAEIRETIAAYLVK